MPSRILLISANRCTNPDPVFPLGLAHLNAALRRAGHEALWVDNLADGHRFDEIVRDNRPDFVGISLRNIDDVLIRKRQTFFDDVVSLVARVRGLSDCPIILGGSGFSIFPERLLELTGANFGICGEGETSLVALINALENKKEPGAIPGLVFRQGDMIAVNARETRGRQEELSAGDRPDSICAHYLQTSGVLNLQTQRGCAFHCCYCTYPLIEGKRHRYRPPEAVADDFEQLRRRGARYAWIVDSVFNSSPRHVAEVCEAILRRDVKLPWCCFLRPQGLSPELMKLMARAGLAHVEFGTDSFCDAVLAAYGKDFGFEEILRSSEMARREHIDACHFLICGGPGETADTLRKGYENSRRLDGAVIMAVVGMRIYPGTALHARALREGRIKAGTDLLSPQYYIAPGLTADEVFGQLQEFARLSPSWIVGDPSPGYTRLVERLRARGVLGPLWSYLAMLQRISPPAPATA
jgi:radical SAM superfamily enzyme YgiQ (UPF0313 family)